MGADGEITVGALLVEEYQQIKEEQRSRIGFRDNLLYATLASMGAVVFAALQADGNPALLLLLPPASVLLGWTYLVNDEKISAIGRYVREELSPRLAALAAGADGAGGADRAGYGAAVFGWEAAHRADRRRRSRKFLQLAADLITFCVPAATAVVVYWAGEPSIPLVAVSLAELAAVAVLGVQIVLYAELRGGESDTSPGPAPGGPRLTRVPPGRPRSG